MNMERTSSLVTYARCSQSEAASHELARLEAKLTIPC